MAESLRRFFVTGMRVPLRTTVKVCALALWLAVLCLSFAAGQEQQDGVLPEGAQYLPEGEGREIVLQACVQCHDLRNTVAQRKTAAGWRRTVDEMVWRGTPLVGDEAETVTRYLASAFGPDKPVPDAVKKIFTDKRSR
jgi:mono/diheme cytochrome c family protein